MRLESQHSHRHETVFSLIEILPENRTDIRKLGKQTADAALLHKTVRHGNSTNERYNLSMSINNAVQDGTSFDRTQETDGGLKRDNCHKPERAGLSSSGDFPCKQKTKR